MAYPTCTIGRMSILAPSKIKRQGDQLEIGGTLDSTTVNATAAQLRVLADQLSGYGLHNTDEPHVPFIRSNDDGIDGVYLIESTDIDYVKLAAGVLSWTARLSEIPDKASPQVEVVYTAATRSNAHGATGIPWFGIPSALEGISGGSTVTSSGTVTLADGTTLYLYRPSAPPFPVAALFSPTPSAYYRGACRIEWSPDSGTTWYKVVGRQMPDEATWWRITNDRTRVTGQASMGLRVETWDNTAGAWEATDFVVGTYSGGFTTTGAWEAPSINYNRPDFCSLRISWPQSTSYVDFGLYRGSNLIEGYAYSRLTTRQFALYRAASEAATSVTGGIEAASADANGNKFTILSPQAITKVTAGASGIYLTSAAQYFSFGLANTLGSSPFTAAMLYWGGTEMDQAVVSR